nr:MAG TPA: hypothetical protein [Caudoviricetes sp.]
MNKIKELGQVMTPVHIISHMIDILSLTEEQKQNCLFCDNSCGDGGFIRELLKRGVPADHIFACDIDKKMIEKVAGLIPATNLLNDDAFEAKEWFNKFDFVIGNPPYVRIHNLKPWVRDYLRENYFFCQGMFDLYQGFYELGLKMLKPCGVLLYITPNGFVKSASGKAMRDYIDKNNLLFYYEDFKDEQVFNAFSTYTCIVGLSSVKNTIPSPWNAPREHIGLPFETIQNGIATLADDVFILRSKEEADKVDNYVYPIYKASTGQFFRVIIPPKSEEELALTAPKTYAYLLSNKDRLFKRDLQKGTQWFELGRTQGLANMNKDKLAISTMMNEDGVRTGLLSANTCVYSGLYATGNRLEDLEEYLNTQEVIDYLMEKGKPMRNGWVQINATLLKNY